MRWAGRSRRRGFVAAGLSAGVLAVAIFRLALLEPERVEAIYTTGFYPLVVRAFSWISGFLPFSLAELFTGIAALLVLGRLLWRIPREALRRRAASPQRAEEAAGTAVLRSRGSWRRAAQLGLFALAGAGALYAVFLGVWGLNYARPRLEHRLGLPTGEIGERELLQLAARISAETTRAHGLAGLPVETASRSPLDFGDLSAAIDDAFDALDLPGDPGSSGAAPVKAAVFSGLMSKLGISGIFVPFTGEPTVNTGPPDVAVVFTAAHEKAHQRAVTHEGEASFAAYLALSQQRRHPYLRYAASFFAARHLLAAARHAAPRDRERVWAALGPGPRRDLDALDTFWARHRGLARGAARRVNDSYLRTMRIPDGAQSYGAVVRLLIADLRRRPAALPPAAVTTDDTED